MESSPVTDDFLKACCDNLPKDFLRKVAKICLNRCIFPELVTVAPYKERYIKYAPLTLWIPDESEVLFGETDAYPFTFNDKKYVVCMINGGYMLPDAKIAEVRNQDVKGEYGLGKCVLRLYHLNDWFSYISDELQPEFLSAAAIVLRRNDIPIDGQTVVTIRGYNKNFVSSASLCQHIRGDINLEEKPKVIEKSSSCSMM